MATPPPRLQKLPPEWAKLQRAEARKLLATERKTLVSAKHVVKVASDAAVVEIARQPDRHHAEILALILLASQRMKRGLAKRLREGRERSRLTAIGRIRAELTLAGIGLAVAHALTPRTDTDGAHADASAATFAAAWGAAAVYLASEAERADKSVARAISGAAEAKASNLERIVVTDGARVYNDQRREDMADLAETHRDAFAGLADRWDAMMDACPACGEHEGELTGVGDGFRSGDEPGYMHPFCRCVRSLIRVESADLLAA